MKKYKKVLSLLLTVIIIISIPITVMATQNCKYHNEQLPNDTYIRTEEPSCNWEGYDLYICSYCGNYKEINIKSSPGGHNLIEAYNVNGTVVDAEPCGYATVVYKCTRCPYVDDSNHNIKLFKHNIDTITIPSTYDKQGYKMNYCTKCQEEISKEYLMENKYEFNGNVNKSLQNSAVVFFDGSNYYLYLWDRGKDYSLFSYSKNSDSTMNFTIRSNTTCIIPDDNYSNGWSYSEDMPTNNISSAVLYKYENNNWQLVKDEWEENTNSYIVIEGQTRKTMPQEYVITFKNIPLNNIEDIVLWYKDDFTYQDTASYINNNHQITTDVAWEEFWNKHSVANNCETCHKLANKYRDVYFDKHFIVIDENNLKAYDYCNTNEHIGMEEQYAEFNELNNKHFSQHERGHIQFWVQQSYYDYDNQTYNSLNVERSKRLTHSTNITVNYIDNNGNKVADSCELNSRMFDEYTTEAKEINGYILKDIPANAKGITTENNLTVNYIYDLKNTMVVIKYVDENNNELASKETISGKVFDKYETKAKEIDNYSLIELPSNAVGIMKEDTIEVIYKYQKNKVPETIPNHSDEPPISDETNNVIIDTGDEIQPYMIIGSILLLVLVSSLGIVLVKIKKNRKNNC